MTALAWRRRSARWLVLVVLNLLAIAVMLSLLEAGTRIVGLSFPAITRPGQSDRGLWVYDKSMGWFHAPGARGQSFMGGPDRGLVRINSLGLRGPEVAVAKPAGMIRVLVFGDSFVFGVGVDEEHLLTSRLQALLDKRGRAAYAVFNMGVSGYSTDQEYLLFQELGVRLHPDVVILIACDNDFEGNTLDFAYQQYYKPYFAFAADGQLQVHNVPVPRLEQIQRIKLWLGQRSNVWNAARSRQTDSRALRALLDPFQVAVPRTSGLDEVEITAAIVGAFAHLAERVGADFVLFNTGHRREKTPLFQALRPQLRREGIRQLGLEGNFEQARAAAPNALWDFGQDPHWNVDAHLLAADVVCNFIDKQGLLARREASVY